MLNHNTYLSHLIEKSKLLGLPEKDIQIAQDFLTLNELGLSFDTIVTQMYEYNVEITEEYYRMLTKIGEKMKIPLREYDFMQELIKT